MQQSANLDLTDDIDLSERGKGDRWGVGEGGVDWNGVERTQCQYL